MVHRIYFYDSHVGTGRVLVFALSSEEEASFNEALKDFKFSLRYTLDNYNYIVLTPVDVKEDAYTNIVVDCSENVLSYLIEFAEAFFKIRGFIG